MTERLEYIYKIECKANSKIYVGRTCNYTRRKLEHFRYLRKGKHCNKHLQSAFNKYGEDKFEFSVIEETTSACVKERELYWFNKFKEDSLRLFNHNIVTSDGGVDAKSAYTRSFIFDALDDKYYNLLTVNEICDKYKISNATYYAYLDEWETLRNLSMPRSVQQVESLKRLAVFVEDFHKIGKEAYRNLKSYGLSHQALVKHLPRFGLTFNDVRLDHDFRTTKDRATLAIKEYNLGASVKDVTEKYSISLTTFYKYKEQ